MLQDLYNDPQKKYRISFSKKLFFVKSSIRALKRRVIDAENLYLPLITICQLVLVFVNLRIAFYVFV